MESNLAKTDIKIFDKGNLPLISGLILVIAAAVVASTTMSMPALLAIPLAIVVGLLAITDYKKLFFILWATIPLSTEVEFGSLGTDLPDELLMVVLMGIAIILFIQKAPTLSFRMFLHPVTLLLLLHVAWIGITTVTSTQTLISLKFLVAKLWYVSVFYFLSYYLVRKETDLRKWLYWLLIPVVFTVLIVLIRHSGEGFSFESINSMLKPFYRNHVDYALMLGVIVPFVVVFRKWIGGRVLSWGLVGLLLIAIYFAFTRAAYVGLVTGLAGVLLIRFRLLKPLLIVTFAGLAIILYNLADDNRYIDFAPDYNKTISHQNFENLLTATYKLEDISTMERVYRWVAGFYMIGDRPWTGFGPGAFYESYMPYVDEHFRTYVSDNPERSGIHNYFLMTATDQGIPGLVIFIALLVFALLKAQWLYHRIEDGYARRLLTACTATLFFILFILLLNDMVETDKVGTFFFFCLAMIVAIEERYLTHPKPAVESAKG